MTEDAVYELACQYIRLTDHVRLYQSLGIPRTTAMDVTLVETRYELDLALGYKRPQIRNAADWNARVLAAMR